jgi:hypothetical protein
MNMRWIGKEFDFNTIVFFCESNNPAQATRVERG